MKYLTVVVLFLVFFLQSSAEAKIIIKHRGNSNNIIIFLHGLFGDPVKSFRSDKTNQSWFKLMATDHLHYRGQNRFSDYSIVTVRMNTGRQSHLSIPELAQNLLIDLQDSPFVSEHEQIIFISHSLGGVVLREMLLLDFAGNKRFSQKTKGMIQLAVPAEGAQLATLANALLARFNLLPRAVEDLRDLAKNSFLLTQSAHWERFMQQKKQFNLYCAYETRPIIAGLGLVVPRERLDPTCNLQRLAVDKNHFNIAKPDNRSAPVYRWVANRVAGIFQRAGQRTAQSPHPRQIPVCVAPDYRELIKGVLSQLRYHRCRFTRKIYRSTPYEYENRGIISFMPQRLNGIARCAPADRPLVIDKFNTNIIATLRANQRKNASCANIQLEISRLMPR